MLPKPAVIKNGRLIDPLQGLDQKVDLLIEDGLVASVERANSIEASDRQVIEAEGLWVLPGLIDLHVHLRDPGQEYKEDLVSGLTAAAAGGFTAVLAMPNTSPSIDRADQVESLLSRAANAGGARLYQSAAMTRGRAGQEINEYYDLQKSGAKAVTDDGSWVADASVMRRALDYASVCGLLPLSHAEESTLAPGGMIHEGRVSTKLGLPGQPSEVEAIAVYRDLAVAALTGKPIHICHVSSAQALVLIREAKTKGVKVTCETAPHYLHLTERDLLGSEPRFEGLAGYDTNLKMKPPLRTQQDLQALRQGLLDGTIDVIATDHAPHSVLEKDSEFSEAAFGITGLETSFSLIFELIKTMALTPARLVELMSARPAKILNVPGGTLRPGSIADLTLIDPAQEYVFEASQSKSKSRNTPFDGRKLTGRVIKTIVGGHIRYQVG
ncbi:MAG: dihydroorotase [Deltaproteobacteria bacterium]|jgi:dihydroorotase|nr:dihydroorotase [Deltaproteobacteria bacterium]